MDLAAVEASVAAVVVEAAVAAVAVEAVAQFFKCCDPI